MTSIICVDLSSYQAGFDFTDFAAAGGLGVILKATEGVSHSDSHYSTFRAQALDNYLAVASYHFFSSASAPEDQASHYLSVAKPAKGERVVCDWENDSGPDEVVAFMQHIRALRPDLQLTVYSGHTAKQALGSTRNVWLADNTSLWLAEYSGGSAPQSWPTATWPTWALWQYSGSGQAPGFTGPCDLNRFNGTDQGFLEWMGPAETATPTPSPQTPVITISADRPVQLVLGANVTIAGASS